MKNRILAVLLALALCLALLPTSVFAVEDTSADASSVTSSAAENDEPSVEAEEPVSDTGADASAPADPETPEKTADEPEASEPVADTPEEPAAPEAPASSEEPAETDAAEPTEEDEIMTLAEGDPEAGNTSVAKIGDTEYATLDEAVAAAADGATIELLRDSELTVSFNKSLTFTGNGKITCTTQMKNSAGDNGWWGYSAGNTMTFDGSGVEFEWTSPGSSTWLMLCLSGTLTVTNGATVTFRFNSNDSGTRNAIYMTSGAVINVTNGSTLRFLGAGTDAKAGQAIQLDSTAQSTINVSGGSTFLVDGTNRGYVNSPNIYVTNSTFTIQNCTSNGSNGGLFVAENSTISFLNNKGHGLSATVLKISDNSVVTCNNNAYYGVTVTKSIEMDGTSKLTSNYNGPGYTGGALRLTYSSTVGTFENGAKVELKGNYRNALENYGTCTFADGVELSIIDNYEPSNGGGIYNGANGNLVLPANAVVMRNEAGATGGGVRNKGIIVIPDSVQLYNNHAVTAGDDIYNDGTLTFSKVGSNWILDDCDDAQDCSGAIDGWYYDGQEQDARWNAHDPYYIRQYQDFDENGMATITGQTALKAAHGIDPVTVPELPDPEWTISRSKMATNLDGNYESQVTLSLPSAEEQLVSDVVFVLDKSTSADLEQQALTMLRELQGQLEGTGAKINVGVVIFNKVANSFGFYDLATQYSDIEAAITKTISSGTNSHAGLLAGMDMLAADTDTDDSRKYLIFVSDGITYMYNEDPTVTAWTFKADTVLNWAGPDNWNSKYGTNAAPDDWSNYLATVGAMVDTQGTTYEHPYGGTATISTPLEGQSTYANSVDKALYLTYQAYQAAAGKYHCYAMTANQNKGTQYAWGPSFMNYLANGEDVSFEQIQNDIVYLVDAGSTVVDYMGYAADDYNFDFVNEASAMTLTVGDASYDAVQIADNQYGFKPVGDGYAYTVTYEAGNLEDTEHFVWAINEAITNFAPVQLTYTVKLTNPKAEAGTYGTYDADGSQGYEGLYTNNSAILYPVDTTGSEGEPQEFAKPTVSYTVKETPTEPTQPTEPTEPTQPTEPTEPTKPTEPTQPAQPTQPGGPTQTSTQTPQKTETTTPKTGDSSNLALPIGLAAVCAVALGVLIPLSRKRGYSGKREK